MKSLVSMIVLSFVLTLALIAQTTTPPQRGAEAQRGAEGQRRGGRGRGDQPPGPPQKVAWVDRTGKVLGVIGTPMVAILDPSISPDGKKVAVRGRAEAGETEHTYILEGTTKRRLTNNEGSERHQFWSTKGDRILFSMQVPGQGNVSNLFIRNSDGSGMDQPLVVSEGMHKWAPTWSPDGKFVVYHTNDLSTQARDIGFVDVASRKTDFLVQTAETEALPRFSIDGDLVGYQAQPGDNAQGQWEVWVTTFPKSNNKWKISTNGGQWARFSKDEIFYWEGNNLMAVKFTGKGASFKVAGAPTKLFAGADVGMGTGNIGGYNFFYDYRDGKFVVVQRQ